MDIILDEEWKQKFDTTNLGFEEKWYSLKWIHQNFDLLQVTYIPACNQVSLKRKEKNPSVWYFLKLPDIPYQPKSHEYSIEFEGVNYRTTVWINGHKLGEFLGGGFRTRLQFPPEILSINRENYLIVHTYQKRLKHDAPLPKNPWGECQGIFRSVNLLILEKTRIRNIKIHSTLPNKNAKFANIKVDFIIKNPQEFLDRCYAFQKEPQITYELYYLGRFFSGEQQINKVLIQTETLDVSLQSISPLSHVGHDEGSLEKYFEDSIDPEEIVEGSFDLATYFSPNLQKPKRKSRRKQFDGIQQKKQSIEYNNSFTITIKNPILWSPNQPNLYQLSLYLHGIDQDKHIRFGIREITTNKNQIYLNHELFRLKGIGYPSPLPTSTKFERSHRRDEIVQLRNLGFNAIRTLHGPHDSDLFNITDEEGILVIEDFIINSKWRFNKQSQYNLVINLLSKFINRDVNHPSIVIWSLGHNITFYRKDIQNCLKMCIRWLKKWDSSRLISFSSKYLTNHMLDKYIDIFEYELLTPNNFGLLKYMRHFLDVVYYEFPKKPVLLSKFGAEISASKDTSSRLIAEKKQAIVIQDLLPLFNNHGGIAGWTLWHYKDFQLKFHSKKGMKFNHNGIFSPDHTPKKAISLFPNIIDHHGDITKSRILPRIFRWIFRFTEIWVVNITKFLKL